MGVAPEEIGNFKTGEVVLKPLGVRLLMDEWNVGEDPKDHEYLDPYGNGTPNETEARGGLGGGSLAARNQPMIRPLD